MKMLRHAGIALVLVAATLDAAGGPALAADVVLGSGPGDKIAVQINKKSPLPSKHSIQFSAKTPAVVFTAGGGATDDPVANGAAAVVFSATDCQCIVMGQAPATNPGWKASPTQAPKKYVWKDVVTKSTALVKSGQLKFKKKADVTYGLDAAPQGEVEVQVRFGTSPDTLCARFAAPAKPASDDTAVKYKSKVFATGTTACSAVPVACGSCVPPLPTTTTTSTTVTTTTSSSSTTSSTIQTCGIFVTAWGGTGSADGQLLVPYDVVADGLGHVIVADTYNHRIQEFDTDGNFLFKWGSEGFLDGQFEYPSGLGIDSAGSVFTADTNRHQIEKFDPSGVFLAKYTAGGSFQFPFDVAVDRATGNFYVADTQNSRIQKLDPAGNVITTWGTFGTGNGQFDYPASVAVDGAGNVFVSDANNRRIQKFDANGTFLLKWDGSGFGDPFSFGPWGLTVGPDGRVFVADGSSTRVTVFTSTGGFLAQWGSPGTGDGQFNFGPRGVAVDGSSVYVVDRDRVQKFSCP